MSGIVSGRRRERSVIRRVALPQLEATNTEPAVDTRVERSLGELEEAVNSILETIEGNIDLGNLD